MFRYIKMVYHSTLVYSMVDISIRSNTELAMMSVLVVIAAIINALIYGQFAVLTEELKRDTNEFLQQFDLVNEVMHFENLPEEIQEEVRLFFLTTTKQRRLQEEQQEF